MTPLETAAAALSDRLRERNDTLALAESCTGGLVAASLVQRAGASDLLAGSFVTYQTASKRAWLGVPRATLDRYGAVSPEVAAAMVAGAAVRTPHATVAASVTGHLGPDAPADDDGRVVIAVRSTAGPLRIHDLRLTAEAVDRGARQIAAATLVLQAVEESLASRPF